MSVERQHTIVLARQANEELDLGLFPCVRHVPNQTQHTFVAFDLLGACCLPLLNVNEPWFDVAVETNYWWTLVQTLSQLRYHVTGVRCLETWIESEPTSGFLSSGEMFDGGRPR